jgi:hypothetical protein
MRYTIEYKSYLIHINADGTASTYFGDFKSELSAKQGVTKYARQFRK